MTKRLHAIRIYYDVLVVADNDCEYALEVAKDYFDNIIENEQPKYEYTGSVYAVPKDNPWYSAIPYGDEDGKPCQYYTSEAMAERKAVVKRVKDMLTPDEWDALTAQLCDKSN